MSRKARDSSVLGFNVTTKLVEGGFMQKIAILIGIGVVLAACNQQPISPQVGTLTKEKALAFKSSSAEQGSDQLSSAMLSIAGTSVIGEADFDLPVGKLAVCELPATGNDLSDVDLDKIPLKSARSFLCEFSSTIGTLTNSAKVTGSSSLEDKNDNDTNAGFKYATALAFDLNWNGKTLNTSANISLDITPGTGKYTILEKSRFVKNLKELSSDSSIELTPDDAAKPFKGGVINFTGMQTLKDGTNTLVVNSSGQALHFGKSCKRGFDAGKIMLTDGTNTLEITFTACRKYTAIYNGQPLE
jgi:hypothetical protein